MIEVTAPNSVHMLWAVPQYFLLTLGELMFSIPGVEFTYSQSPVSMKSVVMSCWLLTTAVGNLLVILIEAASIFELPVSSYQNFLWGIQITSKCLFQSYNSFLYAGLMLVAMFIFALMAMKYKYVEIENPVEVNETKKSSS